MAASVRALLSSGRGICPFQKHPRCPQWSCRACSNSRWSSTSGWAYPLPACALLQQPRYKNNVSVSFQCRAHTACLFVSILAAGIGYCTATALWLPQTRCVEPPTSCPVWLLCHLVPKLFFAGRFHVIVVARAVVVAFRWRTPGGSWWSWLVHSRSWCGKARPIDAQGSRGSLLLALLLAFISEAAAQRPEGYGGVGGGGGSGQLGACGGLNSAVPNFARLSQTSRDRLQVAFLPPRCLSWASPSPRTAG